ncbi:hypothetical protein AB0P21_39145 [Kribbella sp. NPDC056861]|uniref:hypothetical protein n=1 Tax=Kribbella sp. NPDC056861 TaxID=3154857 RepID=UPI003423CD8A
MKRVVSMVLAGGVVGGAVVRRILQSPRGSTDNESQRRWLTVTINRPPEEVAPQGRWPDPITDLGDTVEVEVRAAPGGKGTELAVRLRHLRASGSDDAAARTEGETPQQAVRSALRQAKQLIEVGEVLRVDPAPHGKRRYTPGGLLLDAATRRAGQEGVL